MNIIILIIAGVSAYILTCIYDIVQGKIAEWQLNSEKKSRYKSELYCFKVRKILIAAYNHGRDIGLNRDDAARFAARYTQEIENNYLVDNKYKLLKGA